MRLAAAQPVIEGTLCADARHAAYLGVTKFADGTASLTSPQVVVAAADSRAFSTRSQAAGSPYIVVPRADAQRLRVRVIHDPWPGMPTNGAVLLDANGDPENWARPTGCAAVSTFVGPSFFRLDNPWLWAIGLGGAAVVGGGAWFLMRRR